MAIKRLKHCPFCGFRGHVMLGDDGYWYVGCKDDPMCIGNIHHMAVKSLTRESAIELWNRRAFE